MNKVKTLEFKDGSLIFLDQRKIPSQVSFFKFKGYRDVEYAIKDMVVRGAPAIGVAGAYGMVLAAREYNHLPKEEFIKAIMKSADVLGNARPTAVNLMWAISRMKKVINENINHSNDKIYDALLKEAKTIEDEDIQTNRSMAKYGNTIVPNGATILTHCNAGALATVDYGTALGVIREAHYSGKNIKVYADETRPRLQGAKLTCWELIQEGISTTLIPDTVSAVLMRDGKIDLVLVGADRIALNGDTANKIGTFMISQIAKQFNVPFYIVAPTSTIDFDIKSGEEIVIEERDPTEVTHINGVMVAPEGIKVYNPAFDVTPHENITGIITEKGIVSPPLKDNILKLRGQA
jgi:methylthioribose-1-phosphate isomerase